MTDDTHSSNNDPAEEHGHKHTALTVAVIVATLFIVGAWLLFLPYQLQRVNGQGEDEAARWQDVREDVNADTTSFREALESMRGEYDSLEERVNLQEGSKTEDMGASRVPPEVIERLRDKLSELQQASGTEEGEGAAAAETDSDTSPEETHASQEETE